jgi:hypothetical protein
MSAQKQGGFAIGDQNNKVETCDELCSLFALNLFIHSVAAHQPRGEEKKTLACIRRGKLRFEDPGV